MSTAASLHPTPEQMECAIRGIVRRSITDEDEAALIITRVRRVLNGETTREEVSGESSVIPEHALERFVKGARISLEHMVDGIAEAIAAYKQASIGQKSNDAGDQSFEAENRQESSTEPTSNNDAKPSALKSSETDVAQPTPRSEPVKKAPRPWGPLSKCKPTFVAECPSSASGTGTENQTVKACLEVVFGTRIVRSFMMTVNL